MPNSDPAPRPRVSVYLGASLDLQIAEADGSLAFLERHQHADYGYDAFIADVDALVMGRRTYDAVLGFGIAWPFGERRVVVCTHRPLGAVAPDAAPYVTTHAGPLAPLLERLGTHGVRHVYLDGGETVRRGLQEDVVDALTFTILPEVVGNGRPLFDATVPPSRWTLGGVSSWPSGAVQLHYERTRDG
jgi:dihydrofolate reductase